MAQRQPNQFEVGPSHVIDDQSEEEREDSWVAFALLRPVNVCLAAKQIKINQKKN